MAKKIAAAANTPPKTVGRKVTARKTVGRKVTARKAAGRVAAARKTVGRGAAPRMTASTRAAEKKVTARVRSAMSVEHKEALARGRQEGRAVRAYLEAIEAHKPKRGRRRTAEGIGARLEQIDRRLVGADPLGRLLLTQERLDLETELQAVDETVDLAGLEEAFVKAAKSYGERKNLSYSAWRAAGVSADLLRRAGIARTRR